MVMMMIKLWQEEKEKAIEKETGRGSAQEIEREKEWQENARDTQAAANTGAPEAEQWPWAW